MTTQTSRHKHISTRTTLAWPAMALVIWLLLLPKAGIQIGPAPISWGYALLGLFGGVALLITFQSGRITIPRLLAWLTTLPFSALVLITLGLNGFANTGMTISLVTSFVILPLIILIGFDHHFTAQVRTILADKVAKIGVFLALFGILFFFVFIIFGILPDVPGVTSIAFQEGGWLAGKSNIRAGARKLTSTFANGNLFGVCMLMLGPLVLARSGWLQGLLFRIALMLTLSRTVLLGMLILEAYNQLAKPKTVAFPFLLIGIAILFLLLTAAFVYYVGGNINFLFDTNLGGRADTLGYLSHVFPLSPWKFQFIPEIVYIGVAYHFGWIGLGLFVVAMVGPILVSRLLCGPLMGDRRHLAAGMAIYLILCMVDGAILLIPVMAYYWFMVAAITLPNTSEADQAKQP